MDFYYFNKNVDNHGWHEIHKNGCSYMPDEIDKTMIGYCSSPEEAEKRAKSEHPSYAFDGCFYCCRSINHG